MPLMPLTVNSFAAILAVALFFQGCTDKPEGPIRFQVTGQVTYNGVPLPAGEIQFIPDTSRGSDGPGSIAIITNGRYETLPGKGVTAGPMQIQITGYDGQPVPESQRGLSLFANWSTTAEVPERDSSLDFEIPLQKPGTTSH